MICFVLSVTSQTKGERMFFFLWIDVLSPLGLRYRGEGDINTSHFNLILHSSDAMPGSIVDTRLLSLC